MDRKTWDCDLSEDLCRVYRDIERAKAASLDVCDVILTSPSDAEHTHEWIPASEWTQNFKPDK